MWLAHAVVTQPGEFGDPYLLMWAASIAVVDLLPIPSSARPPVQPERFPLRLAVALIYPPPVAGAVAFLGQADHREFRREVTLEVGLWNHAQIALSVIAESLIFHGLVSLDSDWYVVAPVVLLAAVVGYAVNALLVAWYHKLQTQEKFIPILLEMHVGVFGEFLLSYMGLALFSVFMATSFVDIGPWSLVVFVAPLPSRQMFARTYSLHQATQEIAAREREKEYQAHHDSLTDLPNRVLFLRELEDAIERASEDEGILAVMVIDLDGFKEVNDTLGHFYGDLLLREIGPRLSTALRDEDVMARLGGDEFGIVLPSLPEADVAVSIARRLLEEFERPVTVDGVALDISGSIGIALFPTRTAARSIRCFAEPT